MNVNCSIIWKLLLVSNLCFPAAFAQAKIEEEAVVESVSCSHGSETRQLVVQTKDAGCVLHYTKYGKTEEAGASRRYKPLQF